MGFGPKMQNATTDLQTFAAPELQGVLALRNFTRVDETERSYDRSVSFTRVKFRSARTLQFWRCETLQISRNVLHFGPQAHTDVCKSLKRASSASSAFFPPRPHITMLDSAVTRGRLQGVSYFCNAASMS